MPTATERATADAYMALINAFPLRRLKTSGDHARAKAIVLRLSTRKPDRGTAEYLDVLVDLVADYEVRVGQAIDRPTLPPAELVRHRLAERGTSVSAMAREIGMSQSNLSEMLSGKRGWSKTAIRGLSAALNIRAERFLG